jgi:hypothetical protein
MQAILIAIVVLLVTAGLSVGAEPLPFEIKLDTIHQELTRRPWEHPRVTAIPGKGLEGGPAVLLTLTKSLGDGDQYSGVYWMRSDDLGKSWTKPECPTELDHHKESDTVVRAFLDVTPGWHPQTGKVIAIGCTTRYQGPSLEIVRESRSVESAYAVFDPTNNKWTKLRVLDMPPGLRKYDLIMSGCAQWVTLDDGTLLLPVHGLRLEKEASFKTPVVLHCSFDGETLKVIKHGDEIELKEGKGLQDPSLCRFQGRFFLTMRFATSAVDPRAYVSVSDDGLRWKSYKLWTFDDGTNLGSYNTQQHWVPHSDGLFLAYTRVGAENDHIIRNRAPLFIAQVDPEKLQVLRRTEKVLLPERGAAYGNFGAAAITANESWVTDSESFRPSGGKPHARGANGSVFSARVLWSQPNREALGR